ncbi:MAG: TetR family transcriptional regulator [Cyanobacteria bacterium J06639_1]
MATAKSSSRGSSSRTRLIAAAIQLFARQGLAETTTRQVADLAEVNEVTLFRQFNSKYGLLLAVLQDEAKLQQWLDLVPALSPSGDVAAALRDCVRDRLSWLLAHPALTRSLVGEAELFAPETRTAIAQWQVALERHTEASLQSAVASNGLRLSARQSATVLNAVVFGYAIAALTQTDAPAEADLSDFGSAIAVLLLAEPSSGSTPVPPVQTSISTNELPANTLLAYDLPATTVRSMLLHAKKMGGCNYAIVYLAFASGIRVAEMAQLKRSHVLSDPRQLSIAVPSAPPRQVPVNRWVLSHRYGSYSRNPLTQWLKSRKDDRESLFLTAAEQPATESDLRACWQRVTAAIATEADVTFGQARDTWLVDMLTQGMTLADLSAIAGATAGELEPYARRATEKVALARALDIDRQRSSSS